MKQAKVCSDNSYFLLAAVFVTAFTLVITAAAQAQPTMEFVVTVPANTPPEDTIYLHSGWSPTAVFQMEKIGDRTWHVHISEDAIVQKVAAYDFGTHEFWYTYSRGTDLFTYAGGEYFDDDPDNVAWHDRRVVTFAEGSVQHDTVSRWRFFQADGEVLPTMSAQPTAFQPRVNGLEFQAGIQINDFWVHVPVENNSGFYLTESTSQAIGKARATWAQIAPPWDYAQIHPTPVLHSHEDWEPHADGTEIVPSYSEAALRAHIRNLKAHGFKVVLRTQICCNAPSPEDIKDVDAAWWDAWYSQLENFLLFHARVAAEEGVEALVLHFAGADVFNYPNAPADLVQRWEALAAKWRLVYSGPFGYELLTIQPCCTYFTAWPYFGGVEDIKHLFDFLGVSIWPGISDGAEPTQPLLDANAETLFVEAIDPIYEASNLPIVIPSLAFASYDGGSTLDEFTHTISLAPFFPERDAPRPYDGIEQAMVYQAIMKAVAKRPHITGVYSFGYNWVTTPLTPDYSIRGKAAEKVMAEWYKSIVGKEFPADFDDDGKTDVAVYEGSSGNWFWLGSTLGFDFRSGFGGANYFPVPEDYNGDGVTDSAVYDATNGNWFINQSGSGLRVHPSFGGPGFIPVPGDYDGDGKTDVGVYELSTGHWFYVGSSSGFGRHLAFGGSSFVPVPGDYDGDGVTDTAVYDTTNGNWFIDQTTDGFTIIPAFGGASFIPFPGDYDGDGKTDIAVYEQSSGNWFYVGSTSGFGSHIAFGGPNFTPVPGDYDGDGKIDKAVYDATTGNWFIDQTTAGFTVHPSFGGLGYVPVLPQVTILRVMGLL